MNENVALEFLCVKCNKERVSFSLLHFPSELICPHCGSFYKLDEESEGKTLKNFRDLCRQIQLSKDILGAMSVGVSVGESTVEVPFNLLLTRFPLRLSFVLEGKKFFVECIFDALRQEPLAREVACVFSGGASSDSEFDF
ncbi:ferredoxin [Chlamydiifrater phoenicopteri]|uniref:ferredoxin n=1 Tax=Chlamydiifrater phoenicopteri TaxID=2681469 RepID=UPI001BD05B9B|nr:ferredoxin [Chlamydiifrater phoenicopteri]